MGTRGGRVARLGVGGGLDVGEAAAAEVVGCPVVQNPTRQDQVPEDVDVHPLEAVIESAALEDGVSVDKGASPLPEPSDRFVGARRGDTLQAHREDRDRASR